MKAYVDVPEFIEASSLIYVVQQELSMVHFRVGRLLEELGEPWKSDVTAREKVRL